MKQLYRQNSSTSTDTFTSCVTHPQNSPSITGPPSSDTPKHNLYVNPLEDTGGYTNPNVPPESHAYQNLLNDLQTDAQQETGFNRPEVQFAPSNQVVQQLETGLSTTWECASAQGSPVQSSSQPHSPSKGLLQAKMAHPQKSSFKRHKSLSVEKHPRFSEVKERSYCSTDNLHSQEYTKPKLKFRKAVSLASRLHASPATGRKLANYHLIASTKSGGSSPSVGVSVLRNVVNLCTISHTCPPCSIMGGAHNDYSDNGPLYFFVYFLEKYWFQKILEKQILPFFL